MKYYITLTLAVVVAWLLWSGYSSPASTPARFVGDFVRRIVSNAMIGTAKRPDSLRLARYGGIKKFEEPDWLFEFDSF